MVYWSCAESKFERNDDKMSQPSRRRHGLSRLRPLMIAAAVFAGTAHPFCLPAAGFHTEIPYQDALPHISLQTFPNISDEYQYARVNTLEENGAPDLTDIECKVRLRGNSSRHTPKKSYKLHFPEKANPLQTGDGAAKTWALIGNAYDASLLRNWTAMQIGEKLGAMSYTPNCRSVSLSINDIYQGVYLLIETVSVNKHRVHLTEASDLVAENGYLLEMTRYAQEPLFYADNYLFEVKSKLSDDSGTAHQQVAYISDYTKAALDALRSGSRSEAEQYLDIPSLVDNCLANEIFKNIDVGWDSYYLSKDAGGKLNFGPIWDFDLAFGNGAIPHGYQSPAGESTAAWSDAVTDSNPWIGNAMRCQWFRSLLKARFEEVLPELRTVPQAILDEVYLHGQAYQDNYDRTNSSSHIAPLLPFSDSSRPNDTQEQQAEVLSEWLEMRLDWLDEYYHSPEFDAGTMLDEQGHPMAPDNLLAVALLAHTTDYKDCSNLCYSGMAGNLAPLVEIQQFMLEGNRQYCLSFDYSGTGDASLYCNIGGAAILEDLPPTAAASAETQTASYLFTPDSSQLECSLTIYCEGSGTVELSHLTLRRADGAPPVSGDLNADGHCSTADAELLTKWLLCDPEAVLPDWRAGDLNRDSRLDARDLALLKELLRAEA